MATQSIPCPATLIPTKAEFVNAFSSIAQLPPKLEISGQPEEAEKIREQLDTLKAPLSAYYPKFEGLEIPEIEWEIASTNFLQDFNIFVPVTMMEIITSVVPLNFNINVAGLSIDVKSLLTGDGKTALKDTIRENLDSVKNFLPSELKNFQGINGTEIPELQVEVSSQYINTKIQEFATGNIFSGVNGALDIAELTKIKMPTIPSFDIDTALGGEIDETVIMKERTEQRVAQTLADYKELSLSAALKKVIEKLPLDEIGLKKLTEPISIDACKFCKIIGLPTSINLPDTSLDIV